jgi:hypothetical protein
MAVDQHGGRTEAEAGRDGADQFDFAEGQSGGGNDVVDARLGKGFSGLGGIRGAFRIQMRNKRCYTQSIQPGGHIIEDDAPAFGKAFKLAAGKGLVMSKRRKRMRR